MRGKLRLGKTKDSRTRSRVKVVDVTASEGLVQELKEQKEFTKYLLLKGYSIQTTKRYVQDAERFIQWAAQQNTPIEQVGYADVLHYIQGKRNAVKQRTISAHVNSIKHYYNFLALTHQTIDNPATHVQVKGVKRKILYHILTKPELESLYNGFKVPETKTHPDSRQNWFKASELTTKRNKVILGLMVYQGMNTTELDRLTVGDVKLREGKIYIAGTRKSNERTLSMEAHQVLDIMEYTLQTRKELLALTGKQSESLIVSTGQSDRVSNIMQKFLPKLKALNSKITSAQQIRASVITHWLKLYNLREVQYRAGHRYVSSTESYLVNDLDDLSEEIGKYHPII